MRISDWSSDVCSSDLQGREIERLRSESEAQVAEYNFESRRRAELARIAQEREVKMLEIERDKQLKQSDLHSSLETEMTRRDNAIALAKKRGDEATAEAAAEQARVKVRSEEHTSELQSLMR